MGEFIVRSLFKEMQQYLQVVKADDDILVSVDLVRDSELIDLYIVLPGDYLYRVKRPSEGRLPAEDYAMWHFERVENPGLASSVMMIK